MQGYFSPAITIKSINKENEEKSGILYFFRGILVLRQPSATDAISSAFDLFCKGAYYGLTETEKQLLCEARPFIIATLDNIINKIMPEFFTGEDKIRIVKVAGRSLQEQGENMKAKTELLYKYPALLSLLFSLSPTIELREKLLYVASRANTLGEKDFAPRLLSYLKTATITMLSDF